MYIKTEEEKFIMRLSYEAIESLRMIFTEAEDRIDGIFDGITGIPIEEIYPITTFFVKLMESSPYKSMSQKIVNKLGCNSKKLENSIDYAEISRKIAYGQSYELNVSEINATGEYNIKNREQFQGIIEDILIDKDTDVKKLYDGRLFYSPYSVKRFSIIFHPDNPDVGSCFFPVGYYNRRSYYYI